MKLISKTFYDIKLNDKELGVLLDILDKEMYNIKLNNKQANTINDIMNKLIACQVPF